MSPPQHSMSFSPSTNKPRVVTPTPLPYPIDGLVPYGFSCAALKQHCAYEAKCVAELNALLSQQHVTLDVPDEADALHVLLRAAPAQSKMFQLVSELMGHRYYWSSLRHAPVRPPRPCYLRASLTQPVSEPSVGPTPILPKEKPAHHAPLAAAVQSAFGGFEALAQQLRVLARTQHGAGWVWLLWDRCDQRLQLLLETGGCCPLSVLLETSVQVPSATQESSQSTRQLPRPSRSALSSVAVVQARRVGPVASRMWTKGLARVSAALAPAGRTTAQTATSAGATTTAKATSAVSTGVSEPAAPQTPPATPHTAVCSKWTPRYAALFACDLWEHAYLRDFGLDRDAYVVCFWHALDWHVIGSRFAEATAQSAAPPASSTAAVASKL